MKKIGLITIIFVFMLGCVSLKISGSFHMNDGSDFKFENARIKINNKKAIIKTKANTTEIDMHKVSSIDIDIK